MLDEEDASVVVAVVTAEATKLTPVTFALVRVTTEPGGENVYPIPEATMVCEPEGTPVSV